MRTILLSAVALFGTVACAAACSSGPGVSPQRQPAAGPPASSPSSSTSSPAAARSLSLVGDGRTLTLRGAPADPAYVATYPISGLTGMTVAASVFGDLSAACASGGGAVACKALPFFTAVGGGSAGVKVFDAYGHVVLTAPAPSGADAGSAPLPSAFDAGAGGTWGAGGGVGTGVGIEAGSCAPSVTASLAGCSLTVGGVTCDCCDATCAAGAIQACLGSLGLPVGAGGGALGGGLGGIFDDAGLPGLPGSGGFGGSPMQARPARPATAARSRASRRSSAPTSMPGSQPTAGRRPSTARPWARCRSRRRSRLRPRAASPATTRPTTRS
jgi:hypothetical protein